MSRGVAAIVSRSPDNSPSWRPKGLHWLATGWRWFMRKGRSSGSGEDNTMAVVIWMKNFTIQCYLLGVHVHSVCLAHTHSARICTYLNNLWTDMCVLVLVGMAHAFGQSSMCNEVWAKNQERYGKVFVKSSRIYWCGHFSRQSCAFFALLHCKNKLVVLTTEWLPQLQTSCGYESFTLVY